MPADTKTKTEIDYEFIGAIIFSAFNTWEDGMVEGLKILSQEILDAKHHNDFPEMSDMMKTKSYVSTLTDFYKTVIVEEDFVSKEQLEFWLQSEIQRADDHIQRIRDTFQHERDRRRMERRIYQMAELEGKLEGYLFIKNLL